MLDHVITTAISIKTRKWDKDYNADKMESFFRRASEENPDIILSTEGVLMVM